jgi:CheY-like chemotaxis protein
MGGDITAASEYGKGSVFTATIIQTVADRKPMGDVAAISEPNVGTQRVSFIAPEAEVLVVDDFHSNLVVTEGLLRPYTMRVYTCLNGRMAVEMVQAHSFDLVLMDHMMPEMDGMEAARAIRALGGRFAGLPIAVLTAHAVSGMKYMFLGGVFDDFLSKPIETAALDALLQRWIPAAKQHDAPSDFLPDNNPAESLSPDMAGAAKAELAAQRLDLLNHYRWHFMKGLPADQAYYEKFSALAEAMDVPPQTRGTMADLAAAGRRGDAGEIRRLLPDAYETIAAMGKGGMECKNSATKTLADALSRLKAALDKGDSQSADAAMNTLRAMDDLNAPARELYFFLYDALLMGETEKAAGGLAVWMKFFGHAG